MKKRSLLLCALILAGLMVLLLSLSSCVFRYVHSEPVFSMYFNLLDDGTYQVSASGPCSETEITIPSDFNGKPVTSIGNGAFKGYTSITTVTIPDSIVSIGDQAFAGCTGLQSIKIPDSVTSIGMNAFSGTGYEQNSANWENDALYMGKHLIKAKTTISGSYIVKQGTLTIAGATFQECENLSGITIPDSIISIGAGAFYKCTNLSGVTIPDSVSSIGNGAFYNCRNLATVTIGNGITSIGNYVFDGCTSLQSITIGNGVTSIGGYAFSGCTSLQSITIPDSVTSIGYGAFSGCTSLLGITLPDNITTIAEGAFSDTGYYQDFANWENDVLYIGKHFIEAKTTVSGTYTVKEGTLTIASKAFQECENLTEITIPDSVTAIGFDAFSGCTNLTGVFISDIASWCNIKFGISSAALEEPPAQFEIPPVRFESSSEGVVVIPSISLGFGSSSTEFGTSLANPLSIAHQLYLNGTLVTDLVIPDTVTSISGYAFYGCTSITSVTIPDSVTSIDIEAFSDCTNLTNISISDIANWCKIGFGSSSTGSTENHLYLNGTLVTNLVIPDGVTSIDGSAFSGCTSIQSITIPDSVTSISGSAFSNTGYYNHSANWENDVLYIGKHLIAAKTTISGSYTVKQGTLSISSGAFMNCKYLTSITIPDSVTFIGNFAFFGCTSLTSITIPDSVASIDDRIFFDCAKLTDIYYGGTIEQWKKKLTRNIIYFGVSSITISHPTIHCTDGTIK